MAETNEKQNSESSTGQSAAPRAPRPRKSARPRKTRKVSKLPPYNVILINDDDHTYDYVVTMLAELFAYPKERGFQTAKTVDKEGRAILLTTHRELAELKRDQVLAYGIDIRIASCKGSMSAVIEPAT